MPIGALVTLVPRPGGAAELRRRAIDVASDVRAEPGNLATIVLSDPDRPEHTLILELFRDAVALQEHSRAPGTINKGPAIKALLAEPMGVQWLEALDWDEAVVMLR